MKSWCSLLSVQTQLLSLSELTLQAESRLIDTADHLSHFRPRLFPCWAGHWADPVRLLMRRV